MSKSMPSVSHVEELRPLLVALAILLSILVAAAWCPPALVAIVPVAPHLMKHQ